MFKLLLLFFVKVSLVMFFALASNAKAFASEIIDFKRWSTEQHIAPLKVKKEMEAVLVKLSSLSVDQQFLFWSAYCDVFAILQQSSKIDSIVQAQLKNESSLPPAIIARLYNCAARAHIARGNIAESETVLKRALAIANKHEDLPSLISIKSNLSLVYSYKSQFNKAHKQLQEAFQLSRLTKNPYRPLQVRGALGVMYYLMGDYEESLSHFEFINSEYLALGYDQKRAYSSYFIGMNKAELGKYDEALAAYNKALELATLAGDMRRVANIHINVAKLYLLQGNLALVETHYQQAYRLVSGDKPKSIEFAMLTEISGAISELEGNITKASEQYNITLGIYKEHGALELQLLILERLFKLYESTTDNEAAYPYLKEYMLLERYLFKQEVKKVSQEIRGELELVVTEAENKELQQDLIGQQKELDQQKTIQRLQVGLLILFFVVCLIIAISLYKQRLYGKQMQKLALVDELTLIPNRRATLDNLSSAMSLAKRTKQNLTVGVLDIDYFKKVNDQYGHVAGDQVLKAFTQTINFKIRSQDRFGRIGGEEFCLIMPNTSLEQAEILFERILEAVRKMSVSVAKGSLSITCSAGLAQVNDTDADVSSFLHRADEVLYDAKSAGRDCFRTAH